MYFDVLKESPEEFKQFGKIWMKSKDYTCTSPARMNALTRSVNYIIKNNIPGDFVECGVFKGGSCMNIALTLLSLGVTDRKIYLYDTFSGMTPPTDYDVENWSGKKFYDAMGQNMGYMVICPLDVVKKNMALTGYPEENIIYIQGDVSKTLVKHDHKQISLLRLDTDFYESTRDELIYLYPKLTSKGICIVDDYGYWRGSKKAVDDYFQGNVKLYGIDTEGRLIIKP